MVKKGFSLPEVLIAIGIIGILAIILIPQLSKDNPSRSKVIFRKSYNTLAQIVANMINDDVNYPATQFDTSTPPVPRGFNYTTQTPTGTINKFCLLLSNQLNTVGNITCPAVDAPAAAANIATTKIFDMPDGSTWYIRLGGDDDAPPSTTGANAQFPLSATSYATSIIVDIDGPDKGTNCSADDAFAGNYLPSAAYRKCADVSKPCDQNPDTFILGVRYDGKINVGTPGTGDTCAVDILRNPTTNTVK